MKLTIVADDLSGAAEVAATLGEGARIALWRGEPLVSSGGGTVVDLNSREMPAAEAAEASRRLAESISDVPLVIKKIDSLLRGNIAVELAPLLTPGRLVVACPAHPVLGRTVRDGVPLISGRPLHESGLWSVEARTPPHTVAQALGGVDAVNLNLETVRSPRLAEVLAANRGTVIVPDAETVADIEAIVDAAAGLAPAVMVGAAPVCRALARHRFRPLPGAARAQQRPCLIVVGTASEVASAQIESIAEAGAAVMRLNVAALLQGDDVMITGWADQVVRYLAAGSDLVLCIDRTGAEPLELARGPRAVGAAISTCLARTVRAAGLNEPGNGVQADLILTGGETARAVLDALGVSSLEVLAEPHPGAVISRTPEGVLIGTRPGSFGDEHSLVVIRQSMNPCTTRRATINEGNEGTDMNQLNETTLPVIAVTMGDGAGVGPEVTVAAVLNEQIQAICVPVVIGDAGRLRQACEILGVEADIVTISDVKDAVNAPGRMNVIDLGLLPADLPWGELSAVAGDAAYQYIKVAAELAVAGKVQAICTAPLNKEALHMGGHNFPGHTEMLAHLTGTPEVSMMLASPKLRVIHVTTHIGLIDAIAKIEPGLVGRVIRRGFEALKRAGIENPRIGVCAINPHAGEGGLFGYGEEEEKIAPAIEEARAAGIDARGPLPADTAFYLAGRGDYDLIVAMYHDQGHGPMKVLGIEDGVNITVGLPVIRTSVDHGTAFDIAGKGIVRPDSMVEAMRQATLLAARQA